MIRQKAIAEASDIIFTMVGFPSDVEGVYFNETGIFFKQILQVKIVVDLTTSTPTLAEKIAKKRQKWVLMRWMRQFLVVT